MQVRAPVVIRSKMYIFLTSFCLASVFWTSILSFKLDAKLPVETYNGNADGCVPECDSKIYCEGEILHDIQLARIYNDSKLFVDKKLLFSEEEILKKYRQLKNETGGKPTKDQLIKFVDENFQYSGLIAFSPQDYKENPSIVSKVKDEEFQVWLLELNHIWLNLSRKVGDDVREHPDRYSLIYVPNGFILAGGRFSEMYYWDSYWIIRGLLLCDMYDTARGIMENMISLVKTYGHVPNGSRKYYLQRSQPPLLIQMASTYYSTTNNDTFIKVNLEYFDAEFQYWYSNRMVDVSKNGTVYRLAKYNATSCSPRPESYYEDYVLSLNLTTLEEKRKLFTGLKSAAESGWDFSSRHIRADDNSNNGTLLDVETQSFFYVDLNSILHTNAIALSEWYKAFGNETRSQFYKDIAENFLVAIENVLWNEEAGMWFDWDPIIGKSRNHFYASNVMPLWTGSYSTKNGVNYHDKAVAYLLKEQVLNSDFKPVYHGVPTSKFNTSEQWDLLNMWSPLQAIMIQGLSRTNHSIAKDVALKMAKTWIETTYTGYCQEGYMFEKYNAIQLGATGTGGEYLPQKGFGWTNGFIFEIFNSWGDVLSSKDYNII